MIKIVTEVLKFPDKAAEIKNMAQYTKSLELLEPGRYQLVIEPYPEKLASMKKYYFSMESELGRYLGYKKTEIHEVLKSHIGFKINHGTGKTEYQSLSDIRNESEMHQRILELQEYAAKMHAYTFKDKNL